MRKRALRNQTLPETSDARRLRIIIIIIVIHYRNCDSDVVITGIQQ